MWDVWGGWVNEVVNKTGKKTRMCQTVLQRKRLASSSTNWQLHFYHDAVVIAEEVIRICLCLVANQAKRMGTNCVLGAGRVVHIYPVILGLEFRGIRAYVCLER